VRTIFFGSPDFSVPCLEALHDISDIAVVISQPDRPAGRGLAMRPPAVKKRALELGLEVWQPKKVRTAEFAEKLRRQHSRVVASTLAWGCANSVVDRPRRRGDGRHPDASR
jgi:methionyl-tRNA formyltransferase